MFSQPPTIMQLSTVFPTEEALQGEPVPSGGMAQPCRCEYMSIITHGVRQPAFYSIRGTHTIIRPLTDLMSPSNGVYRIWMPCAGTFHPPNIPPLPFFNQPFITASSMRNWDGINLKLMISSYPSSRSRANGIRCAQANPSRTCSRLTPFPVFRRLPR